MSVYPRGGLPCPSIYSGFSQSPAMGKVVLVVVYGNLGVVVVVVSGDLGLVVLLEVVWEVFLFGYVLFFSAHLNPPPPPPRVLGTLCVLKDCITDLPWTSCCHGNGEEEEEKKKDFPRMWMMNIFQKKTEKLTLGKYLL